MPASVNVGMRIHAVLAILLLWTFVSNPSSFASDLALVHAKVYPSPTDPPIEDGMSFQQILASLTTNPATRFGYSSHGGRIAKGMDADLVVLDGDPARDVTAFSKVHQVIRGGKLTYPVR